MKAFELVRLNNGGRMKRAAGPPAGMAEYYSLDSICTEHIDILWMWVLRPGLDCTGMWNGSLNWVRHVGLQDFKTQIEKSGKTWQKSRKLNNMPFLLSGSKFEL